MPLGCFCCFNCCRYDPLLGMGLTEIKSSSRPNVYTILHTCTTEVMMMLIAAHVADTAEDEDEAHLS